jgi:hypothetical protein
MEPKNGDCERTRRKATEKKDHLGADNDHDSGDLRWTPEFGQPTEVS